MKNDCRTEEFEIVDKDVTSCDSSENGDFTEKDSDRGVLKKGTDSAKKIAKKIGAKNLIVAASVLVIGGAVVLNFALFGNTPKTVVSSGVEATSEKVNSEENNDYFASAELSRKQARDEALAVLQTVVDSASADSLAKDQASDDISRIAAEIQSEANIESLIKSKGFEECVAVVGQNEASVIVCSEGLLPNELSQIKEIVYEQAGVEPNNIKIIEKKA